MTENTPSERASRRVFLTTAAGLGAVSLAGCSGNGSGGDGGDSGSTSTESDTDGATDTESSSSDSGETLKIGYSNFTNGIPFEVMVRKAIEWYAADKDDIELVSTAGDGSTSQQISDCRNLLRQGIDGLIMTPADSNGTAVIPEEADVPVFSADIPVNSEQIGMHVGVDQMKYGRTGAQALIEAMKQTWSDVDEYKVLEVQMTQDNSNSVLRSRAFNNVISESDVATVTEKIVISGFSASEVASKVSSWLQSDPELHGAFGNWAGGPQGVMTAFEQQDMKVPRSEDGHIPIASLDANASIIDALKNGYVDRVADQPVMFYGPLALHYMEEYLRNDESALPDIGNTVTTDSVTITGGQHQGVDVWQDQHWAPAEVREFITFDREPLNSPFLTTQVPVITEDNADAPFLWGNITRKV